MLRTSLRSPDRFSFLLAVHAFAALAGCGGKVAGLGGVGMDGDSGSGLGGSSSGGSGYVGGSSSGGVVTGGSSSSGGVVTGGSSSSGGVVTGGSSGSSSGGVVRDAGGTTVDASPPPSGSSSGSGSGSGSSGGGEDASTHDATVGVEDAGAPNNCGLGAVGTTCSPQPLGSCVPSYVPPVRAKGSCTAADVQAFYKDCLSNGSNCSGSDLSSTACFDCLSTSANGPDWGVIVFYGPPGRSTFSVSPFACMAQIGASTECVTAAEEQQQCELAACEGTCESAGATDQAFLDCYSAADNGECASYVAAANALCPASVLDSPACGGTLDEDAGDAFPLAYYQAVAQTVCE